MISIAIVEDNELDENLIESHIIKYCSDHKEEYKIFKYKDGLKFISNYQPSLNIIFMDIEMPCLDGMQTARKLREIDDVVSLIFVTRMAKYAVSGYEVNALDFMVKPVDYLNFTLKMDRAIKVQKKYQESQRVICLSTEDGTNKIRVDEIYYLESYGHYVIYHTEKGEYKVRSSLKEAEEKFKTYNFVRCSNAFIVNLTQIEKSTSENVIVKGVEIPISRSRKKEFLNNLAIFYSNGGLL